MRKSVYGFGALLLAALVLGGCGNNGDEDKPNGLQPVPMDFGEQEEMSAGTEMPPAAEGTVANGPDGTSDDGKVQDTAGATGKGGNMEIYQEVLRGEREFVDSAGGGSLKLDQVGSAVTSDAGIRIEPDKYAVVDLDQDGEPEVIVSLKLNGDSPYGSLVLRCQDGIVYGYIFSQRELAAVKADGTFLASGGAADVGIGRLAFDGADVRVDEFTYSESGYDAKNNRSISYFVDHKEAGKEEYDQAYGEWEGLPDVKWQEMGSPDSWGILKGQIPGQSFAVALDGWGDVTFAAFEPEEAVSRDAKGWTVYGDVCFRLLKDGEAVYTFPGDNENNVWYGQRFGQVLAVAFRDYDGDGRDDILIILEYAGVQEPNADVPFRQARVYTQGDGETVFKPDALLSEYLCYYTDSMEKMYEGLESYGKNYVAATSKTTWAVEGFAREVKQQILGGDFEGLCCNIVFPITVDGVTYQDGEAFLKADFVGNPNPEFLEELRDEPCENMMVNAQGIMMGNGIIWIGEVLNSDNHSSKGLKVIGLNGLTAK